MSGNGTADELYLDAASTEPVSRDVIAAMMPFLTEAYANPLSVHQPGKTAARALSAARASLAADLGARPDDVVFTSGGTESDNLAIKGIAMARMRALHEKYGESVRPRVIISAIEHPAVAQSAQWLEQWFGVEVVRIPVDGQAHIDTAALERELAQGDLEPAPGNETDRHTDSGSSIDLTNRTLLVSVMLANNEVGTIEPADEIARIAHRHGVPVHVDAVQAAGQIPIRMRDWNVDALSISGHKFGTPKGLGALLLRGRVPIEPLLSGGGQERGLRSGTQNVAGAVALAIALHESNERMASQCQADRRRAARRAEGHADRGCGAQASGACVVPVSRFDRRGATGGSGRARHRLFVGFGMRAWPPRGARHAAGHGIRRVRSEIGVAHDLPRAASTRSDQPCGGSH